MVLEFHNASQEMYLFQEVGKPELGFPKQDIHAVIGKVKDK